jgi:hypothetical protein
MLALLLQFFDTPTGDDPGRGLRRSCASGPQVRQYIPVRLSDLLAPSPACRPASEGEFESVVLAAMQFDR